MNFTVKVVVPSGPVTGDVAVVVTVNSEAFVPSMVAVSPVRSAPPVFEIVKVSVLLLFTVTVPKLALPPSATPPPFETDTPISGVAVVVPEVVVVVPDPLLLLDDDELLLDDEEER